ncbi:hypothetical protein M9H77_11211 [Catharanthus roseus]|uniref:Uncharacterized protein n=1 Tax=Catharanthus roseus TaxID=4058 RepID=A0ACC0BDZ2_CATRO|nr:hypothetical protein M9H77_11211 [Catharanthus roseus]
MRTGITVSWIADVNSLGYDNTSAATAGPSLTQSHHCITCIWNHLSRCKLAHHTPGIVVLHYLITDERDLCPPQVRWNQSTVKIREPYKLLNQNPKSIKI